ncbi:MAG: TIGR04372 family glycosyltransferase [Rhodospirillales bacterium]
MSAAPFRIVAFMGCQTLGDFIMYQLTAATVKRAIPGAQLASIFRDDRPYKRLLDLANRDVAARHVMARGAPGLDVGAFDGAHEQAGMPFSQAWIDSGFHKPDLLLTPAMMGHFSFAGPPPVLRLPDDLVAPLAASMAARGLDTGRWFAALHMRETGYHYRQGVDPGRSVDPKTYLPMVVHIIRALGGQVVRLGDPSMTPFPAMAGLVDLSRDGGSFAEQAWACQFARYFIGTDSGGTQLASAFGCPTATTNAIGLGCWRDGDVVLPKGYRLPDGRLVKTRDLAETGALGGARFLPPGVTFEDCSPQRLVAVARHMTESTPEVRSFDGPDKAALGTVQMPLPTRDLAALADFEFWDAED